MLLNTLAPSIATIGGLGFFSEVDMKKSDE